MLSCCNWIRIQIQMNNSLLFCFCVCFCFCCMCCCCKQSKSQSKDKHSFVLCCKRHTYHVVQKLKKTTKQKQNKTKAKQNKHILSLVPCSLFFAFCIVYCMYVVFLFHSMLCGVLCIDILSRKQHNPFPKL